MKIESQKITDFSNGLICQGAVSNSLMPSNVATESTNLDFDRIGCATLRKGQTRVGNQITASANILGLYEFRDSGAGTNNQIISVLRTAVYYLSGATWTSLRTVTTGCKAEFVTYLDYTFMVNGTDATMSWNGDPASGFGLVNSTSAPIGIDTEVFRNRLWIINATDRIYYSSLPNEITGLITWDTANNWIDISPQDGDNCIGLKRSKNALLIFKRNHIYRVYSTTETEPDPKISVGTYSGRSIVEASDGIYFHHPTGIYRYVDGAITCLSQPIVDFINNITVANHSKVAGWCDGDHVLFSVGDVTIGDVNYNNVVLRYTISSKVWTVRTYPTQILCASDYNDGTTIYRLVGDDNGNVLAVDDGTSDNGTSIFYSLVIGPKTLDGSFSTEKLISKMAVIHENAQGTTISVKADSDNDNKYKAIYSISDDIAKQFTTNVRGNKIWFRASGATLGNQFTLGGYELIDIYAE